MLVLFCYMFSKVLLLNWLTSFNRSRMAPSVCASIRLSAEAAYLWSTLRASAVWHYYYQRAKGRRAATIAASILVDFLVINGALI